MTDRFVGAPGIGGADHLEEMGQPLVRIAGLEVSDAVLQDPALAPLERHLALHREGEDIAGIHRGRAGRQAEGLDLIRRTAGKVRRARHERAGQGRQVVRRFLLTHGIPAEGDRHLPVPQRQLLVTLPPQGVHECGQPVVNLPVEPGRGGMVRPVARLVGLREQAGGLGSRLFQLRREPPVEIPALSLHLRHRSPCRRLRR